jgi:hypothetical protein
VPQSRRIVTIAAAVLSTLLLGATIFVWTRSYDVTRPLGQLAGGETRLIPWRGQLLLAHHRATPDPFVRGSWGTTTVLFGTDGASLYALTKGLIWDPASGWDVQKSRPNGVLSRPYLVTKVAAGCRLKNAGGFSLTRQSLPISPPQSPQLGPVFESMTVPFWFIAMLTAIAPVRWILRRRAVLPGHCPGCGYDLRATPDRCPECGRDSM